MRFHDSAKYREALLYLLSSPANNLSLGKVKLMKLLYFADFDHYEAHGRSITGDRYVHLDYGPVPRSADIVLRMLDDAGVIEIGQSGGEFSRYVYQVLSHEPMKALTLEDLATLDAVIHRWKDASRRDIVLASHGEPPWRMTDYGEDISYDLVFFRDNASGRVDEEPPIPQDSIPRERAS